MRIAVAVDGSENSIRAVRQAVKLAGELKEKPTIFLLNVHLSALISPVAKGIDRHQVEDYMNQIAEEELKDAKAILNESPFAHEVVKGHGEVASTILEILKKENIDMLVMGGKGRSTLTDLIVGSVTTKLVHMCPVPVLVVR